jgi:hypothetical protein
MTGAPPPSIAGGSDVEVMARSRRRSRDLRHLIPRRR